MSGIIRAAGTIDKSEAIGANVSRDTSRLTILIGPARACRTSLALRTHLPDTAAVTRVRRSHNLGRRRSTNFAPVKKLLIR